jgi:hypothetical protein
VRELEEDGGRLIRAMLSVSLREWFGIRLSHGSEEIVQYNT